MIDEEYTGPRDLWHKTGDPHWPWRVIRTCIRDREPFPAWVLIYLAQVADGIEEAKGDVGRKLHGILKFPSKTGPQRSNDDEMRIERFAAEFMRRVLNGEPPGSARREAARLRGITDDQKEQSKYLRAFFGLESLPPRDTKQHWKMIIATWCGHNPGYAERYPDLPTTFDFREQD